MALKVADVQTLGHRAITTPPSSPAPPPLMENRCHQHSTTNADAEMPTCQHYCCDLVFWIPTCRRAQRCRAGAPRDHKASRWAR
eukprot:4256660-Pyramimonas_sp.AAC.1